MRVSWETRAGLSVTKELNHDRDQLPQFLQPAFFWRCGHRISWRTSSSPPWHVFPKRPGKLERPIFDARLTSEIVLQSALPVRRRESGFGKQTF